MKGRIFYFIFGVWLALSGIASSAYAQTVGAPTFTPNTVSACPGSVAVTFTAAGSFSATNQFTILLSDASGVSFPTVTATQSGTAGTYTVTATIPVNIAAGTGYRFRVGSSAPVRESGISLATLTIVRPAAPGVTNPAAFCEGSTAPTLSATASAGGTLNWYGTSATGGTRTDTPGAVSNTADGTYYVSQTVGGCESSRAAISVDVIPRPTTPPSVQSLQTACLNDAVRQLSATLTGGSTRLRWYTVPTGGTFSEVAPQPPTSTTGSTLFYVSQANASGCESAARATIEFRVNALPGAPSVPVSSLTYCQGASIPTLQATPGNGGSLVWWANATTINTPSTQPPTVSNQQTATYFVGQSLNGCRTPDANRATITVNIVPLPAPPQVSAYTPTCVGATPNSLSATASAGGRLLWWGTSISGGTSSTVVSAVNNAATATYYVSQIDAFNCESARAPIRAEIKPRPATPTVGSPGIFCQGRPSRKLEITNQATGATVNWFGASGPLADAPTPSTSQVGPQSFSVSQTVNNCESASRGTITITVNSVPGKPTFTPPADVCEGTTGRPLSASGVSLLWYGTSETGGTGSTQPSVVNTSAAFVRTTNYYVSQTNAEGCESDRAAIPVRVKDTPDAPTVQNIEFCQNYDPIVATATPVAGASVNWFNLDGTPSLSAPVAPRETANTYTYRVGQTLEGCPSLTRNYTVRVKPTPGKPGVSNLEFCNNAPSRPLSAVGDAIKWYDDFDRPLSGTPTPSTERVGFQTYRATQTNSDGCESREKAELKVEIKALPGQPSVRNVSYCQKTQDQPAQTVTPVEATGENLTWYNTDGNPFGRNAPTPSIDRAGVINYDVTQTVRSCEGAKARLVVTVNTSPMPAVEKPVLTYCIGEVTPPLTASIAPGGKLTWIDPYDRTADSFTPPTLNVNVDPLGDKFEVYQVGANGCYSARASVRVIVNATPTLSLQAPTSLVNLGLATSLNLKFTSVGPYSYTLTGGYSGTTRSADTTISVMPRGNTVYQIVSVTNGCGKGLPGNPATATVNVRVPTVTTSSLTTATLCAGTAISIPFATEGSFTPRNTFQAELISVADTSRKFPIGASSAVSPVSGDLPTNLPSGQYYVRAIATNPGVAVPGSNSPSILTVRSKPSATLTGTQTIYEGSPANLTFTLGGDGPWTVVYVDSLRSYSAVADVSPFIVEARPARSSTYQLTSVTNSCGTGPLSGSATVTVLPLLGVEDDPLDPLVKAYPVPTTTVLTVEIDLPLAQEPATLLLTDLSGRPVLEQTTRNRRYEIDLSSQPNGLYLLRIQVGNRQTVRKVLKQ